MKSHRKKQKKQKRQSLIEWREILGMGANVIAWLFPGTPNFKLPRMVFCLILFLLFTLMIVNVVFYFTNIERLKRRKSERKRRALDNYKLEEDMKKGMETLTEENWRADEKYTHDFRRTSAHKVFHLLLILLLVTIVCLKNPQSAYALWGTITGIEQSTTSTDAGSSEDSKETGEMANERIPKPFAFRFVLLNPDWKEELETDVEEKVFFYGVKADQTLEEYVNAVMEEIRLCQRTGVKLELLEDKEKNTFYTYTAAEDTFKSKVELYRGEEDYVTWREKAPTSAEIDSYMNGRQRLNQVFVNGQSGNLELNWKLANDYQYYALEYSTQTQNGDAVLYCYAMSIYYAMESLTFKMSEERYEEIYHYIVMRYNDIGTSELGIPESQRKLSQQIFECLAAKDERLDRKKEEADVETDATV